MMICRSLRVTADTGSGLKIRAHQRPDLQGVGCGQLPASGCRVYTGVLPIPLLSLVFFAVCPIAVTSDTFLTYKQQSERQLA